MRKEQKNPPLRLVFSLFLGTAFLAWGLFYGLHDTLPSEGAFPYLYASQTDDHLQRLYLKAIEGAEKSITLIIYSLTDPKIIRALEKKSDEGVAISIIHDPTTTQKGFEKLSAKVETRAQKMRGLMHRKILILDEKDVWIGSANFTRESLKLHANLVVGSVSEELAATILADKQHHHFTIGGQMAEFWSLPESNSEGLARLLELIRVAETSIQVGMFTWTHPQITEAIIAAADRGIQVEAVLDRGQAAGAGKKALAQLRNSAVCVRTHKGEGLFHHKFVWIDGKTLINGSANWTRSAFSRNSDCFLILHDLDEKQQSKMRRLWHIIRATSEQKLPDKEHLSILWKGPAPVVDEKLERIGVAA